MNKGDFFIDNKTFDQISLKKDLIGEKQNF